jgi:hypothetical protein
MGLALGAWTIANAVYWLGPRSAVVRLIGRLMLTLCVILYPTVLQHVVDLLSCHIIKTPADALATLDGGGGSSAAAEASSDSRAASTADVSVLDSNPYFVCWAEGGSHKPAGDLAAATLVLYSIGFLPIVFIWLRRDAWLTSTLLRFEVARRAEQSGVSIISPVYGKAIGRGTSTSWQQPRVAGPRRAGALTVKSRLDALEAGLTTSTNPMFLARQRKEAAGAADSAEFDAEPPASVSTRTLSSSVAEAAPGPASKPAPPDSPVPVLLPDPLLAPFLSDYRPGAWYAKFLDLTLLAILSVTEAMLTRPQTLSHIGTKAAVMGTATLSMATFVLIVNPFLPADAWKRWVRIGLLCLSASCSILNAAAAVLDLDAAAGTTNSQLETFLTVGSYILFCGICIVGCMLVGGFVVTLVAGAKEEKRMKAEAAAAEEERMRRRKWTGDQTDAAAPTSASSDPLHRSISDPVARAIAAAAGAQSQRRGFLRGRSRRRSRSSSGVPPGALGDASVDAVPRDSSPTRSASEPRVAGVRRVPSPSSAAVRTQNPLGSRAARDALTRHGSTPRPGPDHLPPLAGRIATTANPLIAVQRAGAGSARVPASEPRQAGQPQRSSPGSRVAGTPRRDTQLPGQDRGALRGHTQHLAPFVFVADNPLHSAGAAGAVRASSVRLSGQDQQRRGSFRAGRSADLLPPSSLGGSARS